MKKFKPTEGEQSFLMKIRGIKEGIALENTPLDKLECIKLNLPEITRYIIYEILREEIK